MAAANARIGVARAAYFPSLTITGSAGAEAPTYSNLFSSSSKVFLLGPLAGTVLNLPLFDGGQRKGVVVAAHARLEEATAQYRDQVLRAFQEVEDHLAREGLSPRGVFGGVYDVVGEQLAAPVASRAEGPEVELVGDAVQLDVFVTMDVIPDWLTSICTASDDRASC